MDNQHSKIVCMYVLSLRCFKARATAIINANTASPFFFDHVVSKLGLKAVPEPCNCVGKVRSYKSFYTLHHSFRPIHPDDTHIHTV